jgi:16S rRNA (uracil1498-N3)-methyltransferase
MTERYYSAISITGDRAVLADSEAHHLAHVMRAGIGDLVTLFDGSGAEFSAQIVRIARHAVELAITDRREVDRELPFTLTLAVALPKGDRQKWLIEKATELGVTRVVPLATARSISDGAAALDRLRRGVIEASKQCGRNRLMEIAAPCKWTELAARPANAIATRLFSHPASAPNLQATPSEFAPADALAEITIAVGPEGGWTDDEAALAHNHNWRFVDLGPRILRVETAAIVLACTTILLHRRVT